VCTLCGMAAEGRLEGAVAIVTGALGKLGPVWRSALADAGATVVGIDVHGSQETETADVTDRAALEAVRDRVLASYGVPSILVNNAGIDQSPEAAGKTFAVEDVPLSDFRQTLDVNLVGVFNATQVFGSVMRDAGRGTIVNIGSLYATVAPEPSFYDHMPVDPPFLKPAAYGASKAGVVSLTRYFARLWGRHGVRVNALSPGGLEAGQDEQFVAKYAARVPLGRLAVPNDLVGPLLFLCSEDSRYVNGHELRVDGGFTA
jgi:NAD(P)-dependent dehydrogenase (short-subunit alcohol dehydrogenase family)